MLDLLLALAAGLMACGAGILVHSHVMRRRVNAAIAEADRLLEEARASAEAGRGTLLERARQDVKVLEKEAEEELGQLQARLEQVTQRLSEREETLEQQRQRLAEKEQAVTEIRREMRATESSIRRGRQELQHARHDTRAALSGAIGLDETEARDLYLGRLSRELDQEYARRSYEVIERTQEEAEDRARRIISLVVSRCTFPHYVESSPSVTRLQEPSQREVLIGADGELVKAVQDSTKVEIVMEESTPDVVLYSSLDGMEREVARRTVERIVRLPGSRPGDRRPRTRGQRSGPIRTVPAVQGLVERIRDDVKKTMMTAAKETCNALALRNIHPEIMFLLGRLYYRTSYGQNVLWHSREVGIIGGLLSAELQLDQRMGRRSCLLHDVGKAMSLEMEGGHPEIGAEFAQKYGEHPLVVNAIATHHEGERHSLYPLMAQVADAISGARPGARRDSSERYIMRLEQIMGIVGRKSGVDVAYCVQAGREVRVHVDPDRVSEEQAGELALSIAREIQDEVTYPGKIRITLIRETRASSVAR